MKKNILFLIALGLSLFSGQSVLANDINYSVKANIPENQIGKSSSYFDLKMAPNSEQDISVTIFNNSNEKETIIVEVNNALTNQNGVIDYTKHGRKTDESLKYPIEKLVTNNRQKIEFSPGETKKEVSFHIKMPSEKIIGTILGGVHVFKDNRNKANEKQNVTIENLYSYVLGIQIRENLNTIQPVMNLKEIKPILANYRTAVAAKLQNSTPTILRKVSIDAQVFKKNSKEILYKTRKTDMNVAPNTNFNFPINWKNEELKSGKYTLKMHVESDQGQWDFVKDFTIKKNEVKKLNEKAVELRKSDNTLVYVLITIIIMLTSGFIWFYLKTKKED
ncbi:DUF916 and DUF3324 domain-containing protein [Enterococcus faecalis]|uniref:DUF916 and DUF3324 domain-containing protein n=1 Tax=Enterococcus faecalis TaxID=1351 RepID=UPI003CC54D5B